MILILITRKKKLTALRTEVAHLNHALKVKHARLLEAEQQLEAFEIWRMTGPEIRRPS